MTLAGYFGLVTGGSAAAVIAFKVIRWFVRIAEGIKCQLRTDMLAVYYRNKDRKQIRQYEKQNFVKNFEAYVALGGNSFIKDIHAEVVKWEVIS